MSLQTISGSFKWAAATIMILSIFFQENTCEPQYYNTLPSFQQTQNRNRRPSVLPSRTEESATEELSEESIIEMGEDNSTTTPEPGSNQEQTTLGQRSGLTPFTFGGGQQQTTGFGSQNTGMVSKRGYSRQTGGFTRQPSQNYHFSGGSSTRKFTNSPVRTINRFSTNQQTSGFTNSPTANRGGQSYNRGLPRSNSQQFTNRPGANNQRFTNRPVTRLSQFAGAPGRTQFTNQATRTNSFTNQPIGNDQFTNQQTGNNVLPGQQTGNNVLPGQQTGNNQVTQPPGRFSSGLLGRNRFTNQLGKNKYGQFSYSGGHNQFSGNRFNQGSGIGFRTDTEVPEQQEENLDENRQQVIDEEMREDNLGTSGSDTLPPGEVFETMSPFSVGSNGQTSPVTGEMPSTAALPVVEGNGVNGESTVSVNGESTVSVNGNVGSVGGPLSTGTQGINIEEMQRGVSNGRQLPVITGGNDNARMQSRDTSENFNQSASIFQDDLREPERLPGVFGPGLDGGGFAPDSSRSQFQNSGLRPAFGAPGFGQRPRPFPQQNQNVFQQNQNRFQQNQNRFGQNTPRPFQQGGFGGGSTTQGLGTFGRPNNVVAGVLGAPVNMSRAVNVNADCLNSNMKINIRFNGSFNGLIYSAGYVHDPQCVYIKGTGSSYYEFQIRMNSCGTLARTSNANPQRQSGERFNTLQAGRNSFRWNTISVQYNPMIEEEWDQHFKVTCQMGQEYWKTVTFPVVDVNVATGSPLLFTTKPPRCFMEIRHGFSLNGNRISGPVTVGDPLTLIIYMRSTADGFDIKVNNCVAHNGAKKRLILIDGQGCPTQEKLISPFQGKSTRVSISQTALSAYFKAFRFTGSPALYIECDVHMCKGSCPEQRCNWRKRRNQRRWKRSAPLERTEEEFQVSEKVNLFQSIEVRQEGEALVGTTVNFTADSEKKETKVCIPSYAFAATIAVLSIILLISTTVSMCLCFRHRRIKNDSHSMKGLSEPQGFLRNPLARLS